MTRTIESCVNAWPPRYARGDRVAVLYDPRQPAHAHGDVFDPWFVPVLVGGLGAIVLVPALVLLARSHRFARRERMR